jgi:hypothetical protein
VLNWDLQHTLTFDIILAGGEAIDAAGGPALLRPLVLVMHKGDPAGKAAAAGAAGRLCTSPDVAAMLATVSQWQGFTSPAACCMLGLHGTTAADSLGAMLVADMHCTMLQTSAWCAGSKPAPNPHHRTAPAVCR